MDSGKKELHKPCRRIEQLDQSPKLLGSQNREESKCPHISKGPYIRPVWSQVPTAILL